MNFLTTLIDAMVTFVRRNPLTVLVIALLALTAPSLLQGIAEFILYALLGLVLLVIVLVMVFRWKIYRMQKQIKDQFEGRNTGGGFNAGAGFGGFGNGTASGTSSSHRSEAEGDVKIYTTSGTPEKRVSKDVGDYVEFEETKDEK